MPPDHPRSSRLTALAKDAFSVFQYLTSFSIQTPSASSVFQYIFSVSFSIFSLSVFRRLQRLSVLLKFCHLLHFLLKTLQAYICTFTHSLASKITTTRNSTKLVHISRTYASTLTNMKIKNTINFSWSHILP